MDATIELSPTLEHKHWLTEYLKTIANAELQPIANTTEKQFLISSIIANYIQLLDTNMPCKLAFDYNDCEVLVWAEIEDNNAVQEKALARAESKVNATFHTQGFDVETTIVEQCDYLKIPEQFSVYKAV